MSNCSERMEALMESAWCGADQECLQASTKLPMEPIRGAGKAFASRVGTLYIVRTYRPSEHLKEPPPQL